MKNIKTLNNNKGGILYFKTLDDGRLAVGDKNSILIIYNEEKFNTDILLKII